MSILAINPGSTSTKIAVFSNSKIIFLRTIRHSADELSRYEKIADQFDFRKKIILEELEKAKIDMQKIQVVMGRGGLLRPIPSGVYQVNQKMIDDLKTAIRGEHASNLGGLIADAIAQSLPDAKAYIADPVVVDELEDIARIAGHPLFERISIFHALNHKAVARFHAKCISKRYEDLNLIVVHLGGGITVGAHLKGRVIDVNQGLDGEGPFSPERSGTLPVGALAKLCFSGNYSYQEVKQMITGKGGFVAYFGTNDAQEVENLMNQGDPTASLVFEAMAYQVAKEIGAMSTVLKGKVDGILLTGGLANNKWFIDQIIDRVVHIGPISIYPGEDEMKALAVNGQMVLDGEIEVKEY
ncbi:MAG TPA: butyrate kinase [Bacteroidia bacterium]|nr:butyrate kinase [Bacteroidia bacterium]HRS59496.1 butyrate kinase [Bacteroidia bacterium]HRU67612.1 butyrate kinase [Bacteroidia bacterium]